MTVLLQLAIVGALLIINEYWARHRNVYSEFSRKFIHISVGSLVAFWPFWLSWQQIEWVSLAFLVVIGISKQLGLFKAIHSVQRPTWGEFFFAASVGVIPFITHDKWIYATALLQMSLADGLAAVVGLKYGNGQAYKIFGHTKSLVGSLTFLIVSLVIMIGYVAIANTHLSVVNILTISIMATFIENFGIAGLDNALVPLFVAYMLRHLV